MSNIFSAARHRYEVTIDITGAIHRPPYPDQKVAVWGGTEDEAMDAAKRKLRADAFFDVPFSSMHIKSIRRIT